MGFFRSGPGGIEIEWASNILGLVGHLLGRILLINSPVYDRLW